ncbi:MAG: hypothetical protein AAFX54_04980 [Pseudomonadota bacterium]
MKRLLGVIGFLCACWTSALGEEDASALGGKLLTAMGGDVWADVQSIHNTAVNHHPQARLPYIQEYWYDTERPAHYVTIKNYDMNRTRAYTTDGGWSVTEGEFGEFSDDRLQQEITNWSRSVYRKIYLLARRDEDLALTIGEGGRLEFNHDGELIGWFLLDDKGAPQRHGGTASSENYTEFEDLAQFGSVYWPGGGHDNDGWRFEMLSLEISEAPSPVDYAPPADH